MIDSYVYCVVVHTTIEVGGGLNRGRAHVKTVDQALPNNNKGYWAFQQEKIITEIILRFAPEYVVNPLHNGQ